MASQLPMVVDKRAVKDGSDEDLPREPEMMRAVIPA
jgi:hypothetical protein